MNPRLRPEPPVLPFPERRDVPPPLSSRGDAWDHCPSCGARLVAVKSHLRCPRCRYFMAGSEFD